MFRLGYNIGLKPDEILDMSLDVFNTLVLGYNDYIVDMQAISAQIGYWSAYFQSKRHKKLSSIVQDIMDGKFMKHKEPTVTTVTDIQKFQERELRRMTTFNRWEKRNG